jgi:hypothetical protein
LKAAFEETRERQSPDWRVASRQSGDWRSRVSARRRSSAPAFFFINAYVKDSDRAIHDRIRVHLEELPMPEPLPEHQKTQLIVRSPLSTEGFVSIYFSSPDGRLMSEEEWWNLKQLIELTNKVCVKQQARAQSA